MVPKNAPVLMCKCDCYISMCLFARRFNGRISWGIKVSVVGTGPWSCSTVDIVISFDEKDSISNILMWWILYNVQLLSGNCWYIKVFLRGLESVCGAEFPGEGGGHKPTGRGSSARHRWLVCWLTMLMSMHMLSFQKCGKTCSSSLGVRRGA